GHALEAAAGVDPDRIAVVVRHERERVAEHVAQLAPQALIVDQDEIPGTGRAVQCAVSALGELSGPILVTYGDVPLLAAETLRSLLVAHVEGAHAVTVLTAELADPTGYGRIIRAEGAAGEVTHIVEHRDATAEQRGIAEINSGIYVFSPEVLAAALPQLRADNDQSELYLTDVLGLARAAGGRVAACKTADFWQTAGVNDRLQLAELGAELNRRVLRAAMLAGVSIVDPSSTWIDVQVRLEPDVTILPGTQLHGECAIDSGAVIGPDCTLRAVTVGAGATVVRAHAIDSHIGPGATVGPFAYLRPGSILGERAKVGTFVETKNSELGTGAKVPHLSYVGDATIGEHSNIGAASVFVNYDGVRKSRTVIGAHCRTGSDNMFVAPVSVGD
ncbi:MAG: bifunctional UDP-N-acetylglucosamine diphosphorylase/glucosamine-1-phosphate N-acetyltransferase GlmU, partial [Angustibacter sp.]